MFHRYEKAPGNYPEPLDTQSEVWGRTGSEQRIVMAERGMEYKEAERNSAQAGWKIRDAPSCLFTPAV